MLALGLGLEENHDLQAFLNVRNTLDIQTVAYRYATQLQLCCSQRLTSSYDSFWVQAMWPHPQPFDGYLLEIIQYCLCSPPIQQSSQTRYRGKNDVDCSLLRGI